MGELIVGVLLGPAVFGLIEPGDAIRLLADLGIFFLMFHAGVETQPLAFYDALKRSLGVAIVGAIVPFSLSFGLVIGVLSGGTFEPVNMLITLAKVVGFSISFDIDLSGVVFILVLTSAVIISQILCAGGMALRIGLAPREAFTIGVGMCGRA